MIIYTKFDHNRMKTVGGVVFLVKRYRKTHGNGRSGIGKAFVSCELKSIATPDFCVWQDTGRIPSCY